MNPEDSQGNNNQAVPPSAPQVNQVPTEPVQQVGSEVAPSVPSQPSFSQPPVAPMQPIAPQPSQGQPQPAFGQPLPQQAPYQTPKQGMSKGLLYGIIGGVAALFLIILTVVLVFALGGPSKADYKEAAEKMQQVSRTYTLAGSDFSSLISGASLGSSSIEASKGDFNKSLAAYKESTAQLKDLKALKDKEVKEKYDAFIKKNEQFLSTASSLSEDVTKLAKVNESCDDSSMSSAFSGATADTILSSFDSAMAPCLSAVKELESSSNAVIVKYALDVAKGMEEIRAIVQEMQDAVRSQNRSAALAAQSKLTTVARNYSSTGSNFRTEFRKSVENKEVKDELNALGKIITDKANK